jgi:phospholipid/cholesterol/gamma-HCH transport system permease protein
MNVFTEVGRYILFMRYVFKRPERGRVFWSMLVREMNLMGVDSLVVVILIATITGAVTTVQTASQLASTRAFYRRVCSPWRLLDLW